MFSSIGYLCFIEKQRYLSLVGKNDFCLLLILRSHVYVRPQPALPAQFLLNCVLESRDAESVGFESGFVPGVPDCVSES